MAHQSTIRHIVRGFDRIDAYLDNMSEEDAKVVLVRINKIIKKFDIPANKNSTEKVRSSGPPSTKQVASRKQSDKISNRKPKQESKGMAKELSKADIKAYKDEHGIKRIPGTPEEQSAWIAAHKKHFGALVKKGSDTLIRLVQKNVDEDFKIDGRIRKEEVRAAKAADAILNAGYVPAGKGIAKDGADEKPAKKTAAKTSAKAEKTTSKKEVVKARSSKRTRDEDDDEDEDEAPKRRSKKTTVAEKPAKKAKKVVEKTATKKKVRREDDEDEAPRKKKVKKTSSKDEKSSKTKKKHKRSRD